MLNDYVNKCKLSGLVGAGGVGDQYYMTGETAGSTGSAEGFEEGKRGGGTGWLFVEVGFVWVVDVLFAMFF